MALTLHTAAPDFSLPSTSGSLFTLSQDFKNSPCIVYFYPKDFTPGCTQEACQFRDIYHEFSDLAIRIVGISRDSIEKHQAFKQAHQLNFELLSDKDGKVCKAYDALIPLLGIPKRISYLLDKDHQIVAVFDSLFDSYGHITSMREKAKSLIGSRHP